MKTYFKLLESIQPNDPSFNRWLKGGTSSLVASLMNKESWETKKKGPFDKTFSTSTGIPIGSYYRKLYDMYKNSCDQCSDDSCKNTCYVNSCDSILSRLKSDLSSIYRVEDVKQRYKLKQRLLKQVHLYTKRRLSYISKMQEG